MISTWHTRRSETLSFCCRSRIWRSSHSPARHKSLWSNPVRYGWSGQLVLLCTGIVPSDTSATNGSQPLTSSLRLKREAFSRDKAAQSRPSPLAAIFRGGPRLRTHPENSDRRRRREQAARGMGERPIALRAAANPVPEVGCCDWRRQHRPQPSGRANENAVVFVSVAVRPQFC